eukprot:106805-Prymnesium_polylepis.1
MRTAGLVGTSPRPASRVLRRQRDAGTRERVCAEYRTSAWRTDTNRPRMGGRLASFEYAAASA